MAVFAVIYRYSSDSAALDEHRPAHRRYLKELLDTGKLRLAGPMGSGGPPSALLVFDCDSNDEVAQFLDGDPFHHHNLIVEREVRPWDVVFGSVP